MFKPFFTLNNSNKDVTSGLMWKIGRSCLNLFNVSNANRRDALRAVYEAILQYPVAGVVMVLSNLFAAAFEATTMGMITLAVAVLLGEGGALGSSFGVLGAMTDSMVDGLGKETFFLVFIILAILFQLLRAALQYIGVVATVFIQTTVASDMRMSAVREVMRMSFATVTKYPSGVLQKMAGQSGATASIISMLNSIISNILIFIAYIVVLFWVSPIMTIGAMVIAIIFSFLVGKIIHKLESIGQRLVRSGIQLSKSFVELFQAPKLLRVFGRLQYAIDSIEVPLLEGASATRQGKLIQGLITPLMESLTYLLGGLFMVGAYLFLQDEGQAVMAKLLAFLYILNRVMSKVAALNQIRASFVQTMPVVDKVVSFFNFNGSDYERSGGDRLGKFANKLEFSHVSFSYPEHDEKAIDDLSFIVNKGRMIALVGSSGAGKSTIVDLILGLYEPTKGQVKIDGKRLEGINLADWRSRIGVVSQDVSVLNMTIADNIAFGNPNATKEEVIESAKTAYAHEFIMELPEGYKTAVGDKGFRLSGGQRQRIALARALIRKPDVLILDEATSALDSVSEQIIQKVIEELHGELTIIAVAHRLSTIVESDEIIVLENGGIAEMGKHKELLKHNGVYAKFWKIQSGLKSS